MKTRKYLWLLLTVALLIPLNVSAKKNYGQAFSIRWLHLY